MCAGLVIVTVLACVVMMRGGSPAKSVAQTGASAAKPLAEPSPEALDGRAEIPSRSDEQAASKHASIKGGLPSRPEHQPD
jgi:hypothetical protein